MRRARRPEETAPTRGRRPRATATARLPRREHADRWGNRRLGRTRKEHAGSRPDSGLSPRRAQANATRARRMARRLRGQARERRAASTRIGGAAAAWGERGRSTPVHAPTRDCRQDGPRPTRRGLAGWQGACAVRRENAAPRARGSVGQPPPGTNEGARRWGVARGCRRPARRRWVSVRAPRRPGRGRGRGPSSSPTGAAARGGRSSPAPSPGPARRAPGCRTSRASPRRG